MIETKKEKRESKMIKISYIITFFVVLTFFNTNTFAETKLDCTKYSTKTYLGLLDKIEEKGRATYSIRASNRDGLLHDITQIVSQLELPITATTGKVVADTDEAISA